MVFTMSVSTEPVAVPGDYLIVLAQRHAVGIISSMR